MKNRIAQSCLPRTTQLLRVHCLAVAAFLFVSLAPVLSTAGAQLSEPRTVRSLVEGSRVRVTPAQGTGGLRGEKRVVATVRRLTADSLALVSESARMTLALSEIAFLEVSVGTRRYVLRGMGVGFAAGALTGAVAGLAEGGDDWFFSTSDMALIRATMVGLAGTVAGGLIGFATTSDVWRPVSDGPWADRLSVLPIADPGRAGLGARVSWRWEE